MPWYAVVERRWPHGYTGGVLNEPFATEEEAQSAARDRMPVGIAEGEEIIVTVLLADDYQGAKHEAIRRGMDYRLMGQATYLMGATLQHKKYDKGYHDHCAFCWRRFLNRDDTTNKPEWFENPDDEVVDAGYAPVGTDRWPDDAHWICEECFRDLAPTFHWRVVGEAEASGT